MSHPDDVSICGSCGGEARAMTGEGRTFVRQGVSYPIPADLVLLTCTQCGERLMDEADCRAFDAIRKGAK